MDCWALPGLSGRLNGGGCFGGTILLENFEQREPMGMT
jgi:hypothetical protein